MDGDQHMGLMEDAWEQIKKKKGGRAGLWLK
jgi:hypothetical protein